MVLRFFEKVCLGQWVLRHGFGGREILGAAAIGVHFGRVLDKALSLESVGLHMLHDVLAASLERARDAEVLGHNLGDEIRRPLLNSRYLMRRIRVYRLHIVDRVRPASSFLCSRIGRFPLFKIIDRIVLGVPLAAMGLVHGVAGDDVLRAAEAFLRLLGIVFLVLHEAQISVLDAIRPLEGALPRRSGIWQHAWPLHWMREERLIHAQDGIGVLQHLLLPREPLL